MLNMNLIERLHHFFCVDNCYSIAVRKRNETKGLLFEGNEERFWVLPISRNYWYADPIAFSHNNINYIFCEVYNRDTETGSIGVATITEKGISKPEIVMNLGVHLSYPCVFAIGDNVYMIPETTHLRNVQLFRAEEFPNKWKYERTLLCNIECADSTIIKTNDCLLLLTFEQKAGNCCITKIRAYNAENIINGELKELPSYEYDYNTESRGAGLNFIYKGKNYRPSQVCSPEYGYALKFSEISISNNYYKEEEIRKVLPESIRTNLRKKIIGIHTYSVTDNYEIVDVKFNDPRLKYQIRRAKKFFGRLLRRCLLSGI